MNINSQSTQGASQFVTTSQDVGSESDRDLAPERTSDHARWTKLPRPRGRQPKDPHAETIRFTCRDIGDQERQLLEYLKAPTAPAEHVTLEFVYPVSSAFMVYTGDLRSARNRQQDEKSQHLYGKLDRSAVSIIDALAQTEDPKEQMRRQKAIAKVCIEACEKADGFRYSFHNNWLSREDEACRFSYFCNDSTLNKGRAANEGAGMEGKKMRKPVYDCHGTIAVKFSQTKQSLEIHYKHIPLHQTYAERAPPPRKHSKRYRLMEVFEPDKLPTDSVKRPRLQPLAGSKVSKRSQKERSRENSGQIEAEAEELFPLESRKPAAEFPSTALQNVANNVSTMNTTYNRSRGALITSELVQARPTPPVHRRSDNMPQRSMPAPLIPVTSSNPGSLWVESSQAEGAYSDPQQTLVEVPLRGIAADATIATAERSPPQPASHSLPIAAIPSDSPAATVSTSDFEALKAKLEAAEQRIKKLEAEKQANLTPNQSAVWPSYPHPFGGTSAPSLHGHPHGSYPYPYAPSTYHYPPQGMIPAGLQPHPVTPQPPYVGQAPQMNPSTQPGYQNISDSITTATVVENSTDSQRDRGGQSRSQNVKAFVAYTPKPQRPVLDAQRQNTVRKKHNGNDG